MDALLYSLRDRIPEVQLCEVVSAVATVQAGGYGCVTIHLVGGAIRNIEMTVSRMVR